MDKYSSTAPPGIAPPYPYDDQNAYPPNAYPPNAYAPPYPSDDPNAHPPNAYPPNAYPPNTYPPNAYPPVTHQPNIYPPNNYPPQTCSLPPPQEHHQQTHTVVITGGPYTGSYGPDSQTVTCPYCHHSVRTKVENKATTRTHMIALILCLCLCWPCCCCPYCMDSCQGRNHYCPQCNAFLGAYTN